MRIGIDMLGVQSPLSRGRGIGRYARSLVEGLIRRGREHSFHLYAHGGLPHDFPVGPNSTVRRLPPSDSAAEAIERLTRYDPDRLDVLLVLSPFELHADFDPPAKPIGGPALATVLYDLVPFLFQEKYLTWPPAARRFYRNLERLRGYDVLLAISEATRADGLRLLGLKPDRIVNIRGASDPTFFVPDAAPMSDARRGPLIRLGIDRPFVFTLASTDERKNLHGLIDAFRLLPEDVRVGHQLVVACALPPAEADRVRRMADDAGIGSSLVLAGEVPDTTLRLLYQRCAAFAFPSLYEGFGLPILEAMHCGAAVLAGSNSSQPEVVGDAGVLANAHDAADIAAKLARLLTDRDHADELRSRAVVRAAEFSWDDTADRALIGLERIPRHRIRRDGGHALRPRLAVFSPWPPKTSGISDYALRLVRELRTRYAIDLYHDTGYEPDLGRDAGDFACFDHRLFDRNIRTRGYRGILYQLGNSHYHGFIYDALMAHPGVVTLHDFNLSGFQFWRAHRPGAGDPVEFLRREVEACEPARASGIGPRLREWTNWPGGLQRAFVDHDVPLCRTVVERAAGIIVHSAWNRDRIAELGVAGAVERTSVVPLGTDAVAVPAERRAGIRARFGLPGDALIVASFGILHHQKMNIESLDAIAPLTRTSRSALFVFVGLDHDADDVRRHADLLGISDRVRFLGRQPDADFLDLLSVADVGLSLRRPPTNGETSAALLQLLGRGVPTIVTDVATFAEYPDSVVRKVRWDADGPEQLARAVRELAEDQEARNALGTSAMRYVAENHAWSRAADLYAEMIERDFTAEVAEDAEKKRKYELIF